MTPWSIADLADALAAGLAAEEARLREEQAVYGVDALDEVRLHPLIARAFESAGFGVFREVRYPADRARRKASEGERCDFVLTPDRSPLEEPEQSDTLFQPADVTPLDEAFWLEIKAAWQFTTEGPNPRYAAQMLSIPRSDVGKLSKDRHILHAALGMIAFVESEAIARHDLHMWYLRNIDHGQPIGYPSSRTIDIINRHGNGICAIALCPVQHL